MFLWNIIYNITHHEMENNSKLNEYKNIFWLYLHFDVKNYKI